MSRRYRRTLDVRACRKRLGRRAFRIITVLAISTGSTSGLADADIDTSVPADRTNATVDLIDSSTAARGVDRKFLPKDLTEDYNQTARSRNRRLPGNPGQELSGATSRRR